MKSFKVRDGKMLVDGVYYSENPSDSSIIGKMGKIHSISISGRQFFPYGGQFNDGTIPVTNDSIVEGTTKKKSKLGKTELVESSSKAVGIDGKPVKKTRKTK
jgi:hypothetical protein